jgi:osmotically inducible protein OsmC
MIKQNQATAVWKGGLKDGSGVIDSQYGTLKHAEYNFAKRFEDQRGTNPEELIAAAQAACFSMYLSGELAKNKITPESIATTSTATLDMVDGKPTVTEIHVKTEIKAGNADKEILRKAAEVSKAECPISRLLKAKITLDVSIL